MILPLVPALAYTLPNQIASKLISISFKDTPIRLALENLFKSAGIQNYIIDKGVSGFITMTTKDQPFVSVLKMILRTTTPKLTYTQENNVWIIKPLVPDAESPSNTVKDASSWERINLVYRTPQELSGLLGGIMSLPYTPKPALPPVLSPDGKQFIASPTNQRSIRPAGIDNIISVGDGSLVVQGDPEDIDELKAIIRLLDVPVPSVECRIEVVSVSAGKKDRNILLQTMETGKCGTEIKAASKTVGTAAQSSRLDVTIKATPLGDGEFEVETRWEASLPLPGAQKDQLVRLEKTFSNIRRVKAGETTMFGGIVLKEDQGVGESGQEVLFFLTLKPF